MKKFLFALLVLVLVAAVLTGGTAFIIQQNKLNDLQRLVLQADEKVQAGAADEAIPLLRTIESRGGSPRAQFLLGKIFYERGDRTQAMSWFRKIPEKFPKSEYVSQAKLYEALYALDAENNVPSAMEKFVQVIAGHPNSEAADFALYHLARISHRQGNIAQAKRNLEQILKKPKSAARNEAEFLLGDINMQALLGPEPGPGDEVYVIQKGDRLQTLSKKLGVPVDLIVAINKVNPRSLSIGTQLKVPRLNLSVVVDKGERTLTLKNNNQLLKKYHVGINRDEKAVPAGDFVIQSKSDKPEYVDPDTGQSVRPGAPENPLGTHHMTVRRDAGIHGTNAPDQVGKYTTRGWISMKNEDVEELYGLVQAGRTPVSIRGRNLLEDSSPGNSQQDQESRD